MKALPTISVVVPSYNQGRFLAECLDSILAQDYPALDLIVMDGGSDDNSVDVIRRFEPRVSYWQSQPDGGQSAAINAGVALARGDLVAWLNSDDLYCEGALWAVARAWAREPGRALYIGNGFRLNDETGQLVRHNGRHMAFSRRALREGLDYILQPSAFFDVAAWRAAGGLDESLQFCMDWDMFIRLADRGGVMLTDEFIGVSREYEDTKTSSGAFRRIDELLRVARRHTGQDTTTGGSIYALWTLLDLQLGFDDVAVRQPLDQARAAAQERLATLGAWLDGMPDRSDSADLTYLPFPDPHMPKRPVRPGINLPGITVVVTALDNGRHLERALRSLLDQAYPASEVIVIDRGSTDRSIAVVEGLADRLAHWEVVAGAGPVEAAARGFSRGSGEIMVWFGAEDVMAEDALRAVGQIFAGEEASELIHGDALLIDANDAPLFLEGEAGSTCLRIGRTDENGHLAAYWSVSTDIVPSAAFFRRSLIKGVDVSARSSLMASASQFFLELAGAATVRKLDRILAFERVPQRQAEATAPTG